MKLKYRTEIVNHGSSVILVPRLSKELALLETFLYSDVQSFEGSGKWFLEAIDKVLNGDSEHEEITGNVCALVINKERTRVSDNLAEDSEGTECDVGTEQLKDLISTWLLDKQQFQKA
jgi:antitoxin